MVITSMITKSVRAEETRVNARRSTIAARIRPTTFMAQTAATREFPTVITWITWWTAICTTPTMVTAMTMARSNWQPDPEVLTPKKRSDEIPSDQPSTRRFQSVLLTFRFFAGGKDFLLRTVESAGYSRTGYPAQTTVFLASLAALREMFFVRTAPGDRQNRRKPRAPRRKDAKNSDQVLLALCEKRIFGCGSAALCSSACIGGPTIFSPACRQRSAL
jgi:hypothetical protein